MTNPIQGQPHGIDGRAAMNRTIEPRQDLRDQIEETMELAAELAEERTAHQAALAELEARRAELAEEVTRAVKRVRDELQTARQR